MLKTMNNNQVKPEKVTKPIQILGAWLAGLILVNGSFLGVAASISKPDWIVGALVIASIVNVPLFLGYILLLQAKFRPEIKENPYYAKYLESNTGKIFYEKKESMSSTEVRELVDSFNKQNISMISGLEDGLKIVTEHLKSISREKRGHPQYQDRIVALEKTIKNSSKLLENARRSMRRRSDVAGIYVNDLLFNYQRIVSELAKHGLSVASTFGSSSDVPEAPVKLIFGFGYNISMNDLRIASRIAVAQGFGYIHFARFQFNEEKIYFGSYIYRAVDRPKEVAFTDEIFSIIMNEESTIYDVIDIIKQQQT